MEKGATDFDKLCHKVFDASNFEAYRARESGLSCARCGCELETYYCEEELWLVQCDCCKVKALVKARTRKQACYRSGLAWPVEALEDMDESCAVFFDHVPIDEPPVYVGSIIDANFPEDVVCGMYLPCPATDGSEVETDADDHG